MWESRLERLPVLALVNGIKVAVADRPSARLAGLAGMRWMPRRTGLLIPDCRSVHTYGMRFALDLIWLDDEGRIVDVVGSARPGRIVRLPYARAVVESAAGTGAAFFAALATAHPGSIPTTRRAARALR
jgi:uncharacterized membrane protein (UPF0127 family)